MSRAKALSAMACAERPMVGWYGDDFTGATDTLATLAQAGLRAMLFLDVPTSSQLSSAGPLDGVGIAGAARGMDPAGMRNELLPVGQFFSALAPPVLHYKVCSTFDSAPDVGNLHVGITALLPHVASRFVPIVGGQPNLARYCTFSNLYARAGAQGEVHRIDRHPTMRSHPVTPMAESDLRIHLASLGAGRVAALHYPAYALPPSGQDRLLDAALAGFAPDDAGPRLVLFDVSGPGDLADVGRLIWQRAQRARLLAVGPSSVVQALAAHLHQADPSAFAQTPGALAPADGPVFVFAGSLSPVTARQVAAATHYRHIAADASLLCGDADYRGRLVDEAVASLRQGRHTLVHTRGREDAPRDGGMAHRVADASAQYVRQVVQQMQALAPLRRIGVAGGDTSSQVTRSLGLWGLSYLCNVSPGVTLCRTHSDTPARHGLELMLKGGQVGSDDLFNRFVDGFFAGE